MTPEQRFVARIRAALNDYDAGRMTFEELVAYTRRTSTDSELSPLDRGHTPPNKEETQ